MVPSRLSIWRIAAGVFIGNILCLLISLVLYACVFAGMSVFGVSLSRLLR
jgi:hypothetical protein